MSVKPLALWFLLAALTPPAAAGIGKGHWEVGVGAGLMHVDHEITGKTALAFELRGGYFLTGTFQIEGQVARALAEESFIDVALSTAFANAVFNLTGGRRAAVPYLLVGAGFANLEYSRLALENDDSSAAFQIAAGNRLYTGPQGKVAVRIEAAFLTDETFDDRSNHVRFTVGLSAWGWD